MKKFALILSLPLMAAAPAALAQDMTSPEAAPATATTQPAETPAPPAPATPPATPDASTPAGPADAPKPEDAAKPAEPGPSNSASAVETAVNTGFGKYDADGDGNLSETEFKTWIAALKTEELKASGQAVNGAEVTAYANAAFASADADKDSKVSKAEVTSFLGG